MTSALTCAGFWCVDRDECYHFNAKTKEVTFIHDGASCKNTLGEADHTFRYRNHDGKLQVLTINEVQELMKCTYTSKLLFQRAQLLRNYPFWGFSEEGNFDILASYIHMTSELTSRVAIGHVPLLSHVEEEPLGLFAAKNLSCGELLGEYTGAIKVSVSGVNEFDPYGMSYPSVYENGDLYVSASEYGNIMRCINHSAAPNARFVPLLHNGVLRIFCFVIEEIEQGNQILVDYGPTYWRNTRLEPIEFHKHC